MYMKNKVVLVTGGLGFIGKHFVEHLLQLDNYVINIDMVSYASDRVSMKELSTYPKYQFTKAKIEQLEYLPPCDLIVNFAAESHVDSSISNTSKCFQHNIQSVYRLLELLKERHQSDRPGLVHISTDEVYGDIIQGSSIETDLLKPSNPYSASKAAGDMLIHAWGRTYDLSYKIVRMTNVYGRHQHPEKLIPKTCMRVARGLPATVHGNGSYIRTWLHTSDAVRGILLVATQGKQKEIYNIGGVEELTNLQVIKQIQNYLNPNKELEIDFVPNRPGQDLRYSLNSEKIRALGWKPEVSFKDGLEDALASFDFSRFIQPWSKDQYVKIV